MCKININKNHQSKTLHLLVGINDFIGEGLMDTKASMLILVVTMVRELGIMHLMFKSESYGTTSRVVMRAMGRIEGLSSRLETLV